MRRLSCVVVDQRRRMRCGAHAAIRVRPADRVVRRPTRSPETARPMQTAR
jgi:hypothetical protein